MSKKVSLLQNWSPTLLFIIIYGLGICIWCTFESSCQQSPDCVNHTLENTFLHDEHAARCINRNSLSLPSFRGQPALINARVWDTSRHSCLPDDIRPWDKSQQSKHFKQRHSFPSQSCCREVTGTLAARRHRIRRAYLIAGLWVLRQELILLVSPCACAHCWRKIPAQTVCAREQLQIRLHPCVAVLSDVTVRSSWSWHVRWHHLESSPSLRCYKPSFAIFFHPMSSEKLKSMQGKLQWPRWNETKTTHVPNMMPEL